MDPPPPPELLDPQQLAPMSIAEAASIRNMKTNRFLRGISSGARKSAARAISPLRRSLLGLAAAAAVSTETLICVVVVVAVTLSGAGGVQVSQAGAPVQVKVRVPA